VEYLWKTLQKFNSVVLQNVIMGKQLKVDKTAFDNVLRKLANSQPVKKSEVKIEKCPLQQRFSPINMRRSCCSQETLDPCWARGVGADGWHRHKPRCPIRASSASGDFFLLYRAGGKLRKNSFRVSDLLRKCLAFLTMKTAFWYHIVDNLPIVGHSGSGIAPGLFDNSKTVPSFRFQDAGRESARSRSWEGIPSNPPPHADFRQ